MGEAHSRTGMAREIALLALLATLWGGSYSLIKIGVATIPPITLIAARTVIAGSLLLVVMHARGLRLPRGSAIWRRFLFQAGLLVRKRRHTADRKPRAVVIDDTVRESSCFKPASTA